MMDIAAKVYVLLWGIRSVHHSNVVVLISESLLRGNFYCKCLASLENSFTVDNKKVLNFVPAYLMMRYQTFKIFGRISKLKKNHQTSLDHISTLNWIFFKIFTFSHYVLIWINLAIYFEPIKHFDLFAVSKLKKKFRSISRLFPCGATLDRL